MQFNNVDLALQLLDQSSLGKDIDSFRRTKNKLSRALKGSVDSMPAPSRYFVVLIAPLMKQNIIKPSPPLFLTTHPC